MQFLKEDIDFNLISPSAFEEMCYDLLVLYNFKNLVWRDGGADNGRDIEGNFSFITPIRNHSMKFFFECKRYQNGVSPTELHSKIAWADAESPDYLVFFISSYITNSCRAWLDKIRKNKTYEIVLIEGKELKERVLVYESLVSRYFSVNKFADLLLNVKHLDEKYGITPSWPMIDVVVQNIDINSLEVKDIVYLMISTFENYYEYESRNEYSGDFNSNKVTKLFENLFEKSIDTRENQFYEVIQFSEELGSIGFINEIEYIKNNDFSDINTDVRNAQFYSLHINPKVKSKWRVAKYLLLIQGNRAIEMMLDKNELHLKKYEEWTDKQLIRIIRPISIETLKFVTVYREYVTMKLKNQ